MKAFKQAIALALAFCMLVQPLAVSASEIEPKAADEITTNEPLAASASEIEPKAADEITANEPLAASASEIEPKAADEITTNEPLAVPASEVEPKAADEITTNEPLAVPASEVESKPADGTTIGEPFPKGTAGSNSFRIPSLVTLSDGTLVAAADARWNTTYDGGGLDTIVSRSSDDGANWNYTFANYLGDNGNEYNGSDSTCFLDPAMAVTSDDTIYMLVDLYPYGVALNGEGHTTPTTAKGFDGQGHLLLSNDNHSSYGYYLENGKIYSSDGTEQTGYTVDDHFNVTEPNGTTTNLFFKDSTFKVVRTGFLYLTKSTNKGETWSAPTLLNLKTTSEQVCLVGPGRGLVTSSGMIVFPCYSFHGDNQPSGNTQRLSFIYSTDGTNWNRTSKFNYNWASEAAVVELADGKLRFFFRNGTTNLCYVDYNVTSNAWGSVVNTGLDTNSNCQISAITYFKTVDGKQVILVSCPTGKNEKGSNESSASARLNGKIFVGLVNEDANKTMSWQQDSTVGVNSNNAYFMYSCLAELKDGKVAILYEDHENAWGAGYKDGKECYYTMEFDTFELSGLTFDTESSENEDATLNDEVTNVEVTAPGLKKVDVSADEVVVENDKVSKTYHITLNDGAYTKEAIVKIPYDTGFDGCDTFTGFVSNEDGTRDEFEVEIKEGYFVCTVPHFSDLTIEGTTNQTQDITLNVGETFTVTDTSGNYEDSYTGNGLDTSKATVTVKGETVAGGTEEAVATTLIDETEYYIKNDSGKYLAYNNQISWVDSRDNATLWKASSNKLYSGNRGLRVAYNNYLTTSTKNYNITAWTFSGGKLIEGTYTLGTPYVLSTTNPVNTTEITFKGVSVGKTSVKVGNVTYLITVNQNEVSSSIAVGNAATFSNAGTIIKSNTNSSVATATLNNGILTVNALKEGTTIITTDNCIYTITVNDGTPISIKEKETMELSVELKDGQYVEWSTADSSYVGVAGKYDASAKKYTDKGVIIGHNVTDTPVVVIGTIYNADGTKAGTQKWLVTVIEGVADTNKTQKHIYVNVTAIENCTVYYAINGGELIKINGTGVLVNEDITGHYNMMFFADPDEGYALTYMSVSGSAKQYYTLSDGNPDGTGSGAWPFVSETQTSIPSSGDDSAWKVVDNSKHGFRWSLLEGNMTIEQMKLMFSTAIALGCDGATNFTKNGDDGFSTEVQFAAQKLPDLEKKIVSIARENGSTETYVEGMKVAVGDTINYKIYIHEYAGSYGTIKYSNESLNDPLTRTAWSPDLESSSATASVHSFDTKIKLTKENFNTVVKNGKITNTADLVYDYKSEYSTGTLNASASAVAEITVDIPSYVIDFGLPVTFNLSELTTVHGTIKGASATYGDVSVSGANVTYTPKTTLKDVDYIELELESGHYAIAVYPATTVYYEEGFAEGSKGDWTSISKTTSLKQTAEKVGAKGNVYGFDSAYNAVNASNGTTATSDEASISTFTFTGTGVDIYTNNTENSGMLMAWVKNSAGNTVKAIQVDTHMENGSSSYTEGQAVKAYNVPVISLTGLNRGTYTVELRHIGQSVKSEDGKTSVVYKPVSLDGYRVHGTLDPATMAYQMDGEAGPIFFELRNSVLAGLNVNAANSEYAEDIAEDTLAQVYARAEDTAGAVVLSNGENNTYADNTKVQDLIDNGPKNELYLRAGEAVVFKVPLGYQIQGGMKALNANVSYSLNGSENAVTLGTSTDMFYVVNGITNTDDATQTITIKNNGDGILSITEIKMVAQAAGAVAEPAFMSLEEEDLVPALMTYGYRSENAEPEVTYADATLNIVLNDATGKAFAATTLTANGVLGETNIFSAATIEEAVAALVPEGYELKGVAYADQEVTYGEEATVTFAVEDNQPKYADAKLIVKLTDKKGNVVAEKALTANGLVGKTHTFKSNDIEKIVKDILPNGYKLRNVRYKDQKVVYGEELTVTFTAEGNKQEHADAKLIVKLTDKKGNVIAENTMTANGVTGKTHTFKSNDIKKIVKDILPKNYKLKNTRYSNQKVAYGKSVTITFTVENNKNSNRR